MIQGNLNLITQALEAVGHKMEVIPDPSTVHFHLPGDLSVLVHREYDDFVTELVNKFPHEKEGILKFYGTCWKVLWYHFHSPLLSTTTTFFSFWYFEFTLCKHISSTVVFSYMSRSSIH